MLEQAAASSNLRSAPRLSSPGDSMSNHENITPPESLQKCPPDTAEGFARLSLENSSPERKGTDSPRIPYIATTNRPASSELRRPDARRPATLKSQGLNPRIEARRLGGKHRSQVSSPSTSLHVTYGGQNEQSWSVLRSPTNGKAPVAPTASPEGGSPESPDFQRTSKPASDPVMIRQPESSPISQEQLAAEVKGIYAGLVMVEAKCINIDATQANDPKSQLDPEQWQALIALHRTLLYEHHDFLMATQHPSATPALRGLATKHSMPARIWKHKPEQCRMDPIIEGVLDGKVKSCLADTGAGGNFISKDYAESRGLAINRRARTMFRIGSSKIVRSLGTIALPFSFKGEKKDYNLEFNVLPTCVRDIVLGAPFLRMTKTFTHFAHRITRILRDSLNCRLRYFGALEQANAGFINDEITGVVGDSGSDLMFLSESYARKRGMTIDTASAHRQDVAFGDDSVGTTCGVVRNVEWRYSSSPEDVYACDFYVLRNLPCDVVLSYDFLHATDGFNMLESLFDDLDDIRNADDVGGFLIIKLLPKRTGPGQQNSKMTFFLSKQFKTQKQVTRQPVVLRNSKIVIMNDDMKAWECTRRKLINWEEAEERKLRGLIPTEQQEALAKFRVTMDEDWTILHNNKPQGNQLGSSGQSNSAA